MKEKEFLVLLLVILSIIVGVQDYRLSKQNERIKCVVADLKAHNMALASLRDDD